MKEVFGSGCWFFRFFFCRVGKWKYWGMVDRIEVLLGRFFFVRREVLFFLNVGVF